MSDMKMSAGGKIDQRTEDTVQVNRDGASNIQCPQQRVLVSLVSNIRVHGKSGPRDESIPVPNMLDGTDGTHTWQCNHVHSQHH